MIAFPAAMLSGVAVAQDAVAEGEPPPVAAPVPAHVADPARLPVESTPANLFGGRIVGTPQGYVVVGYPTIEGGARWPFGDLEVTARLRVGYRGPFSTTPTSVAMAPGVGLRWQLLEMGELDGAFVATVELALGAPEVPVGVGVGLVSPGWAMTYRVEDRVDVNFGVRLDADLWVQGDDVLLLLAVPVGLGLEWSPKTGIQLGFDLRVGPSAGIAAAGQPDPGDARAAVAGVGARLQVLLGAGFAF
jgi:hypothetical protein